MDVKDLKVLSAHGAKIMKDVDTGQLCQWWEWWKTCEKNSYGKDWFIKSYHDNNFMYL